MAFAGIVARLTGLRCWLTYKFFRPHLPSPLSGEGGCIVSLTSFPPRMKTLWMTIDTLFRQRVRPAAIYLWLSEKDSPTRELPASLGPYVGQGLEVMWIGDDLKPHNKYWYAFQKEAAGGRRCVVTVDDDLFYHPDTVGRLMELHEAHPDAVCANISVRLNGDKFSDRIPVRTPEGPGDGLVGLGYGAVLYPPAFYATCGEVLDTDKIKATCLKTDDLWLKHCEQKAGTKVVTGRYMATPAEIPSTQIVRLSRQNVSQGLNDIVWARLKEL